MGGDIVTLVHELFSSNSFPKSITHTNSILIPKKDNIISFYNIRLISLSNFIYKVLSRIIHDRLDDLLSNLIFVN